MRFEQAGKLFFLLILGVAAYYLIMRFYAPARAQKNNNVENRVADRTSDNHLRPGSVAVRNRRFDFEPEKPVNGKLKGVIEIGATGFNAFVVYMDKEKRWQVIAKDFGVSLVYEGLVTTEDIRSGLNMYMSRMFDNAVSKKDVHFVISSGAQKEPKIISIANELKNMGYAINLVTPEQEGRFAYLATVPQSFRHNSFLVDIGSGNTKISWQADSTIYTIEAPGAKYYEKNQSDQAVYYEVKQLASSVPEVKRKACFILGGVPFMMAQQTRKGEERYTVLNAPNGYTPSNKRMASGLNIYKAIADTTRCNTFVFDWDVNFSIGYLLNLP